MAFVDIGTLGLWGLVLEGIVFFFFFFGGGVWWLRVFRVEGSAV